MDTHQRLSKRQLETINNQLSSRDRAILDTIRKYRYMTTDQIKRLFFTDSPSQLAAHRAVNRSMARLRALDLIAALERRIGGVRAGSASYVWSLAPSAARLLNLDPESSVNLNRKRIFEPTLNFLEHSLAVSETYVQLNLIQAEHESIELYTINPEPDCWKSYVGSSGAVTYLKPDMYIISSNGEFEDHWFFEIDLSTEAPSRIIKKCYQYFQYYKSGNEQREISIFPVVVWIVKDRKRANSINNHISNEFRSAQENLFVIITPDQLEKLICEGVEIFRSNITQEGIK